MSTDVPPPLIRRSSRATRLGLTVYPDARVVVTVPFGASEGSVLGFVASNEDWIRSRLREFARSGGSIAIPGGRRDYLRHKERARVMIHAHIRRLNLVYGFRHGRVSVKLLTSRWGSCSDLGNLNFNYRLVHLPTHLVDYVIAHELCHLAELNHSGRFWSLVAKAIPDHKKRRMELRRYHL